MLFALVLFWGCTDGTERRLQLEELERQNRADSLMTNDSLATILADYFDRHGTSNEQLRAHYILGRTYADKGEMPQALNAYNDAFDRADTTSRDCDYRTLSRVHAQTAQLYYSQLLPDNMIRHERLAMRYAKEAKDTICYMACYAMLAEGYELKNMNDSALHILLDTYSLYRKIGEGQMASSLCCSMADICRRKKDYVEAVKYMREYETQSDFFDESGNVESGREMYYYCKGLLCLDISDEDNAEYYLRKLLGIANNYILKNAALIGLRQYYTISFDKDSLIRYTHLCDSLSNIAHIEAEMQKTLQVQAMYDFTRNEQKSHQKEKEAEHFKATLIVVCALSVILFLLFSIAYIRKQNKNRRLEDRIQLLRGYAVNKSLQDSSVAQRFRQLLKENPYHYPELNDWKRLAALIDREVPCFRESLNQGTQPLTDFETDVCMLIKIQISSSDIARLKQCSPAYITQIRKCIYKKLFTKKGRADELDEYIMSLS